MPFKVQVGPRQISIHQGQTALISEPHGQIHWPSEKGAPRQNSVRPVFSTTSSSCSPLVAVMQSAIFGDLDYRSQIRRPLRSRYRRILCWRLQKVNDISGYEALAKDKSLAAPASDRGG